MNSPTKLVVVAASLMAARHGAGADANLEFLLDSANRHSVSANAADLGSPIVPLYTDYFSGGTYGDVDSPSPGLALDSNDPDAGRGTSSFRMTWDGSRPNAYFQFVIGSRVSNRPRKTAAFGLARRLLFLAKGDVAGRQVQVNVFRVTAGSGYAKIASKWFPLSAGWAEYDLAFAPLAPASLHAVQFLMDSSHDPGGGTVRLDEVRIGTDGFDPLSVVQSYRALPAATGSAGTTPPGRDLFFYPNRSQLYDNALAILAFVASGDPASVAVARNVADALLAAARVDGSIDNSRNCGHVLLGNGKPRGSYSQLRTLGDNAWFGLALLELNRVTGNPRYLDHARRISDWAEANLKAGGALKGYRGGYDDAGAAIPWRSTEHNVDLFQLNRRLAAVLSGRGDAAAHGYRDRAAHAGDFVVAMFDAAEGRFWTGTGAGDGINTGSLPLDAQLWPLLTMARWSEYADSVDWARALRWAENNLRRTDGIFTGFTYSSGTSPARVWMEGNAIAALAYRSVGDNAKAQDALELLDLARLQGPNADPGGKGVIAASSDDLRDPDLGAFYDARLAVAPSAWSFLAAQGRNPFQLGEIIWNRGGQLVVADPGAIPGAPDIAIFRDGVQVAVADKLTFSYDVNPSAGADFRQALVIDTNGLVRLRHLDGRATASSADKFGTSIKLPPGLILDDGSGGARYCLTARVKTINLVTAQSASGELKLEMTGAPVDGAGIEAPVSVQWTLTIPRPRDKTTDARLDVAATFDQSATLHGASLARAEAFRAAEFSSSNVPPSHAGGGVRTHDADHFRLTSAAGQQLADVALDTVPANTLFTAAGTAFDGQIALNQLMPAPLNGDPPNLAIEILPADDAPDYRGQGYITVDQDTDENSDNLGAWANRMVPSPAISAGQKFEWAMWLVASDEPSSIASQLTVSTAGSGAVTRGFLGRTDRVVGKRNIVNAAPARGFLFDGWTGGLVSPSARLAFVMTELLKLQANFIVNPFPPLRGRYDGLVEPANPGIAAGLLGLNLTGNGTLSLALQLDGKVHRRSGVFDHRGEFSTTILRRNLPALTLVLHLDVSATTHQITGTLAESGTAVRTVLLNHLLYSAAKNPVSPFMKVPVDVRDPATDKGAYTAIFQALTPTEQGMAAADFPQGHGRALVQVTAAGVVFFAGQLADGQPFSSSNRLSRDNELPLFLKPYAGTGAVSGWVTFRNVPGQSDADGIGLRWFKPTNAKDKLYPDGWPAGIGVDFVGSKFVSPAKGKTLFGDVPALPLVANALMTLSDGWLTNVLSNDLSLNARNKVTVPASSGGAQRLDVTLYGNGLFTGHFTHSPSGKTATARGVVFQKTRMGSGYFLGAPPSGSVPGTAWHSGSVTISAP